MNYQLEALIFTFFSRKVFLYLILLNMIVTALLLFNLPPNDLADVSFVLPVVREFGLKTEFPYEFVIACMYSIYSGLFFALGALFLDLNVKFFLNLRSRITIFTHILFYLFIIAFIFTFFGETESSLLFADLGDSRRRLTRRFSKAILINKLVAYVYAQSIFFFIFAIATCYFFDIYIILKNLIRKVFRLK